MLVTAMKMINMVALHFRVYCNAIAWFRKPANWPDGIVKSPALDEILHTEGKSLWAARRGSRTVRKTQANQKSRAQSGKKAAKAEAQPASSPSSDANLEFKKPSSGQVETLAKRLDSIAREAKDLGETKKEIFDKAVETQHFNRTAISKALDWRKRAKKDPAKFSIEFAHFLSYVDDLKLGELANDNRGLAINGEDDEGAGDEGAAQTNLVDAIAAAIEADKTERRFL